VGAAELGGGWALEAGTGPAAAAVPFSAAARGAFHAVLGIFQPTASMSTGRIDFTATPLQSGKVLVAGGFNGSDLASAQLYDPGSNTWSPAGSMSFAREHATATLLNNGKVLVAGGASSSGALASAELYNPVTNTWSAAASMHTGRSSHTATLLQSGKVLVAGGVTTGDMDVSSAELYDPANNTWSPAGSMSTRREGHTATLLPGGKVLVAGGYYYIGGDHFLSSAELYNPVSNSWSSAGSMITPRESHTATLLPGGKVLVAGGYYFDGTTLHSLSAAELYDPVSNSWSSAAAMIIGRDYQTATLLPNGKVLVVGGEHVSTPLATAELYDPGSNSWSADGTMTTARLKHTATLLPSGNVLVAGGASSSSGSSILASAELWTTTLAVQMTAAANNLIIRNDPARPGGVQVVNAATSAVLVEHSLSLFTNIQVACDSGADTLTVDYQYGNPLPSGGLSYLPGLGVDTLNVNDQAATTGRVFTLTGTSVQLIGSAPITFPFGGINFVNVNGGSGSNIYTISNTETYWTTTVNTGAGSDTVNVLATSGTLNVNGQGGGGNDVLNLGNANSLAGINGAVNVSNGPSYFQVNVNDGADNAYHPNVILSTVGLTGLAPAAINFSTMPICISTLNISVGNGNNTYTITGSQATQGTILNTGAGTDTVNVQAVAQPLTINGQGGGGSDVINLGAAGTLIGIIAPVTIFNGPSYFHVNVNDGADNAHHPNVILSPGGLTGLALAAINFSTTPICLSTLNISVGNGNNTYTITGSQAYQGTILNTGIGTDTVNVQGITHPLSVNSAGGSGADAINLGDAGNTLAGITAAVTVHASATDTLTINDQATTIGRTYTVGAASVTWSGGPALSYTGVGSLVVNGGSGDDAYVLTGTSASAAVTVTGGSGNNQLLGSNAGNVWSLAGTNAGSLSGPAYASPASFAGVANVTAGSGGDSFQFADGATITGNLTGGGADTLDYSAYSMSVVVDLQLAAPGTNTGVGGTVSGIARVYGGSAAPAGPGVYNLLIGSGGDYLQGGTGRRNLLVAGGSSSTLVGGDGEDLLIAGSTAYDTDPALANWQAIAAYWAGADDFATRAANLLGGVGVLALDPTPGTGTVTGNGGGNILTGNGGLTLIFTDGLDAVAGFDPSSQQVTIAP
jgi:hypothetical protein